MQVLWPIGLVALGLAILIVFLSKRFPLSAPGFLRRLGTWLVASPFNLGSLLPVILAVYLVLWGFLGFDVSRRGWANILGNPWLLGGVFLFVAMGIIMLVAFAKNPFIMPPATQRRLTVMGLLMIAVLLISFWLAGMAQEGKWVDQLTASAPAQITAAPRVTNRQATPAAKTQTAETNDIFERNPKNVVPSSVRTIGEDYYVTLNGRDEHGFQILIMEPGKSYEVKHLDGDVATFHANSGQHRTYPLWGLQEGYVLTNSRTGKSWDWSANYRYSSRAEEGVMPQEILLVIGQVGSGDEVLVQFPDNQERVIVQNTSKVPQPLVLYYHAWEYYYLGDGGLKCPTNVPLVYPDEGAAFYCGDYGARKMDGWQDQGLDGSTIRFLVRPLP